MDKIDLMNRRKQDALEIDDSLETYKGEWCVLAFDDSSVSHVSKYKFNSQQAAEKQIALFWEDAKYMVDHHFEDDKGIKPKTSTLKQLTPMPIGGSND